MSEMSEKTRSDAKDKVKRLTGEGKGAVDASGWTEDEYGCGLMNTQKKLGNRPISKQNLATGGKAAHRHAGRKNRDMGGQTPVPSNTAGVAAPPQSRFTFGGVNPSPLLANAGLKSGGKADGHWMEKAFSNSHGQLHKELGVPKGEKIPAKKLDKAEHAKSGLERKRANLVKIAERSHRTDGGKAETPPPVRSPQDEADRAWARAREKGPSPVDTKGDWNKGGRTKRAEGGQISPEKHMERSAWAEKQAGMPKNKTAAPLWRGLADKHSEAADALRSGAPDAASKSEYAFGFGRTNRLHKADGGIAEEIEGKRPMGGRMPRASGGSAKKGMNVNIIIAQKPEHQMMPGGAPGGAMPPKPPMPMMPPGAPPPMGPQGAPAGPMPGGPNMPPPSMQPHARGGKVYPDMKFSAANGKGRMEKARKYGDCP